MLKISRLRFKILSCIVVKIQFLFSSVLMMLNIFSFHRVMMPLEARLESTAFPVLPFQFLCPTWRASVTPSFVSWISRIEGFSCLIKSLRDYFFFFLPSPLLFQETIFILYECCIFGDQRPWAWLLFDRLLFFPPFVSVDSSICWVPLAISLVASSSLTILAGFLPHFVEVSLYKAFVFWESSGGSEWIGEGCCFLHFGSSKFCCVSSRTEAWGG